jgi:hypothetical protein
MRLARRRPIAVSSASGCMKWPALTCAGFAGHLRLVKLFDLAPLLGGRSGAPLPQHRLQHRLLAPVLRTAPVIRINREASPVDSKEDDSSRLAPIATGGARLLDGSLLGCAPGGLVSQPSFGLRGRYLRRRLRRASDQSRRSSSPRPDRAPEATTGLISEPGTIVPACRRQTRQA